MEGEGEKILIIDFGGQYKELIARRTRELGVYSVIKPSSVELDTIKKLMPSGIILTGGPRSVNDTDSPSCSPELFSLGIPVLGICYGMQLIAKLTGGEVVSCDTSEYGITQAKLSDCVLFSGCSGERGVLMSHTDKVAFAPKGFAVTASTELCPVAAMEDTVRRLYCVQFHPETENSECGREIIKNFLYLVCGCRGGYSMESFIFEEKERIRRLVGDGNVLLGLSGGVDSSVAAALLSEAIPGQLTCVYIDHGFMREGETEEIQRAFSNRSLRLITVDARERFLSAISGVTDPESKRKIIGKMFAVVFEEQARLCGCGDFLAQGTIYPDVIESGERGGKGGKGAPAVIKSHHNVGGLPKELGFSGVIEPLRSLFKDEVRRLGLLLGLPEELVYRQPFPGPGLAIRIIGEITAERLDILRQADAIVRKMIPADEADQCFCVLTDTKSVGVMGDGRTYEYTLALRAVKTSDFMTCEFSRLPWELLARVSSEITNRVEGINRVVYDISSKPPATIEWE